MLTEAEKNEIEKELAQYPRTDAGGLEALRIVQSHRRWISDEAIRDISDFLHVTPHQIDSLATFYNLIFRKPVGRHVILLCDSISCWVKDYDTLLDFFYQHLTISWGETTRDDRYTLLPSPCLGACDRAPVMMIDEDLHVDLTPEKIKSILEQYP
jgi:NADH-quinone oxidoreductase subunit E